MTADSFELHSQHIRHVTVMGFSAGRPARCQDHMLYSGNRAERKQTALCFYYNPHTPNKCTCHPSTTRSVGQCCNSCHVVFYHFPNAAGSDESLFKNTSEWNIGVFKKMHELHPAPRFGSSRCALEECQELRATMNLNEFCDKAQPEAARARKQGSSLPCAMASFHTLQPLSSQKCVSPRSYSWMFEILEMMYRLISDITNRLEACSAETQDVLIPEQLKRSICQRLP